MSSWQIRKILVARGGVLEGDFFFALKNGGVARKYVNMDPVYTWPLTVRLLARKLYTPWVDKASVIAAPAVGGIPLLYAPLAAFGSSIRVIWADKQKDGSFALERMGFAEAVAGKRVLVLEDVTSTGESAKAVCDLVRKAGGNPIGVSSIWNRGGVTARDLGVPKMTNLVFERIESWKPGEHPQWGVWPLVEDVGHPENFPDYPGPRIKLLS